MTWGARIKNKKWVKSEVEATGIRTRVRLLEILCATTLPVASTPLTN